MLLYEIMNQISKDLIYECLNYLDWKEYYHTCKIFKIDHKFKNYFKICNQEITINMIVEQKEEYLEIFKYLFILGHRTDSSLIDRACSCGHLNIVKYLHEQGHQCSQSAMNWASNNGHIEVVKFLYSINIKCTKYAAMCSCSNGHLEIIKFFRSFGAKFDSTDMYWAVKNGHFEVVKFLHSLNVNYRTPYTFDEAVYGKHFDIVEFLHSNSVECTNKKDVFDWLFRKGYTNILELLRT